MDKVSDSGGRTRKAGTGGPEHANKAGFFPDPASARHALEAGRIGLWTWDVRTNRIEWSTNLAEIHRLPPASFDGSLARFEKNIHPDDRAAIRAAITRTLQTHENYRVRYRIPQSAEHDERWIEAFGVVIVEQGVPVRVQGVCQDITERMVLEGELRDRIAQQEAISRLGERALAETDLERLLDEVVHTVAETLQVDFATVLELIPGDAELLMRAGVGWKPGIIGATHIPTGLNSQSGYTLSTGGPVVVEDFAKETRFGVPGVLLEHDIVSSMSVTIAGRDGRAYGVLTVHTRRKRLFGERDISFLFAVANVVAGAIQRRQMEQRQELMIRELRHRSGNLFSQLLALFSQTARNSKNIPDLVAKYEARVLALASAHRLITEGGWKSTSLMDLLRALLAPYLERVSFNGPDVFLEPDPSFSLSAAVHELATNASKYGSLSRPEGRLELSWSVGRTDRGATLTFNWAERNGPPARRPRRPGFGSKLVTMVIERQLNGEVRTSFQPGGLHAELVIPLTHERWPVRARVPSAPPSS